MTRLGSLLLRLIGKLLSSDFVRGSIKRLLLLFDFIQQRFSMKRASNDKHSSSALYLQPNYTIDLPISNVICPSSQPHLQAANPNSIYAPNDEQYMTSIHSSASTKGYHTTGNYPVARGSRSHQDIRNLPDNAQNDTTSISGRRSGKRPSSSLISLPLPHHGHALNLASQPISGSLRPTSRNSQRPDSGNSQPIKVSRVSSAAPSFDNIALPAGATAPPDGSGTTPSQQSIIIVPISAASVQRWDRNVPIPTDRSHTIIEPLEFDFLDEDPPLGWVSYTHPEGALYFFHEGKRIYTDANLHDPKEFKIITESAYQILGDLNDWADEDVPDDVELVLEIISRGDEIICGYYFVNHESRCLFWLTGFDASAICNDIKAVVSSSHLGHEIQSQYWMHWELYPSNRHLIEEHLHELRDIILHAAGDTLTSRTSTAVLSAEQNAMILSLLSDIKSTPGRRDGVACFMGRIMRHITHYRFLHLYGQRGARLDSDQSIHVATLTPRPLFIKIFVALLFWAPDIHLRSLRKIWVDRVLHRRPWFEFIKQLHTDYQEFSLMATVLLSANMSFLAIQSVDNGGDKVVNRSAAQISSYISIVTSLGTVIFALLLSRQNRSKGAILDDAARFLGTMAHQTRGLEPLAILYALPYALLMWSALTFLGAFSFTCFSYSNPATRVLVGTVLLALAVLTGCCLGAAWITRHQRSEVPLVPAMYTNFWTFCKSMLPRIGSEVKSQEGGSDRSVGAPACHSKSPVSDGKPGVKRRLSLIPEFLFRKATSESHPDGNELQSV